MIAANRTMRVVWSRSALSQWNRNSASDFRETAEFTHHALIHRAFERHHELRDIRQRLPAPGPELGVLRTVRMRHVDLAVRAEKAHGEPLLRLTAIFAAPGLTEEVAR